MTPLPLSPKQPPIWLLLVLLASMTLLLASSFYSFRSYSKVVVLVRQSNEIQLGLDQLLLTLVDAETGQRGYLLTGKPEFLEPYARAVPEVPENLRRVDTLLDEDVDARRRLRQIERLARDKLAELAETVALQQSGDEAAVRALVRSGRGKHLMDEIRRLVGELVAQETAVVELRKQAAERHDRLTAILVVSSGATLPLALAIAWALRRQALQRLGFERQREALIEEMPMGVALAKAPSGEVLYGNRRLHALLGQTGFSEDQIAGVLPQACTLRHPDGQAYLPEELPLGRTTRGEELRNEEMIIDRADGSQVIALCSGAPIRGHRGKTEFGVIVLADITDKKRTERALAETNEELMRLNAGLEQRVRERTAQLEEANQELEAFSYSVSHDLRTPLRAVAGFCQVLEEDYADRLDDEGRHALARLHAAALRMGHLIDDLLELSRVTRVELRRGPVNLTELGRLVVNELRERQPERTVEVVIQEGMAAVGDSRLLRIALGNLLGNAWKFTAQRADARIEFGAAPGREGGPTVYSVRDNGAGFPMEYAGRLFTPFQRLHSAAEFEGTGIGLALVKRIISKHGGHIEAEAAMGQGATFRFTLEAAR
ncbi:MAG TPA: CHASE3 domain-containing protein [Polyangia bacterium]|jgi:PAS domain S-box-containing protein|nr:CHASE3 domain-containing protein [Polyangia bacterium]